VISLRRITEGYTTLAEVYRYLATHDIPFDLRTGSAAICADRRHRSDAIFR
jgi:hypothetical protein